MFHSSQVSTICPQCTAVFFERVFVVCWSVFVGNLDPEMALADMRSESKYFAFTLGGRQVLLGTLQALLLHVHVFQLPNSFSHFVIFDPGSLPAHRVLILAS